MAAITAMTASATINGVWRFHPSLDIDSKVSTGAVTNNVTKIIDTGDYCYFQITGKLHQGGLKSTGSQYENRLTFPARLDKREADAKVVPLAETIPLSGEAVTVMEYSRKKGYLVLMYENRMIDVIFDSGEKFSLSEISNHSIPADMTGRNISFDLEEENFYIATRSGYIAANVADRKITEIRNFGEKVNFAATVGSRMLVGTTTALYNFPADEVPQTLEGATPMHAQSGTSTYLLDADGNLAYPYMIFPVADDEFIYVSTFLRSTTATSRGLSANVVTLDAEDPASCELTNLFSDATSYLAMGVDSRYSPDMEYDGFASPAADGVTISTDSYFYYLHPDGKKIDRTSAETVNAYKAEVLTAIKKDTKTSTLSGTEASKRHGSYDGTDFIFYYPRQGFKRRQRSGDTAAEWTAPGDVIEVNATAALEPMYMVSHPDYGLLVRNWGLDREHYQYSYQTDGLGALDAAGNWRQFSMTRLNNANSRIVTSPSGLSVDPAQPNMVYGVQRTDGILRQNLEDASDFLFFTRSNKSATHEKHITVTEPQTGSTWADLMGFTPPIFDDEGTMWTFFDRLVSPTYPDRRAELWYWSAEDRVNTGSQADYDAHPMKVINIPGVSSPQYGMALKGKCEGNKSIFAVWQVGYTTGFIFDHNGTPEDESDDRVVSLDYMIDENGDKLIDAGSTECVFEDPYDGKFIISTQKALVTASKSDIFDYDKLHVSNMHPEYEDGNFPEQLLGSSGSINSISIDNYGRKWMASRYDGIYCLSPDRSKVLAYYNSENSPLPAAQITAIYCDRATGAVNIATEIGLVQFYPEGTEEAMAGGALSILPRVVDNDYNGYVRFSGLADGIEFVIEDIDGNEAATLRATAGRADWHTQGVPAGIYRLRGVADTEIIVNR